MCFGNSTCEIVNENDFRGFLDVNKPNEEEKIKIKSGCNKITSYFCKKHKEQIDEWTNCDDGIFRLLSIFLKLGKKLEIFLGCAKT